MVGNKSDLEDRRVVSYDEGKKLAESLSVEFLETSAKDTSNIDNSFIALADNIIG